MARAFDGGGTEWLSAADNFGISTGPFSIRVQIKNPVNNGTVGIVIREDTSGLTKFIGFQMNSTLHIVWELYDGTHDAQLVCATPIAADGAYHDVIVTTDKTTLKEYLDGTQDANTVTDTSVDLSGAGLEWNIGRRRDSAGYLMCDALAEVAIWKVALTQGEVTTLAAGAGSNCVQSGNLVAYWKMNTNTSPEPDWKAADDMTLHGSPSFVSGPSISYCDGGRTALNTRSNPLGVNVGMGWRMGI